MTALFCSPFIRQKNKAAAMRQPCRQNLCARKSAEEYVHFHWFVVSYEVSLALFGLEVNSDFLSVLAVSSLNVVDNVSNSNLCAGILYKEFNLSFNGLLGSCPAVFFVVLAAVLVSFSAAAVFFVVSFSAVLAAAFFVVAIKNPSFICLLCYF